MKVTVYGANWCAFCKTEMQWLDSKDVSYEYKNIDEDEIARKNMHNLGFSGVPLTAIDDENGTIQFVHGFDRKSLTDKIGM